MLAVFVAFLLLSLLSPLRRLTLDHGPGAGEKSFLKMQDCLRSLWNSLQSRSWNYQKAGSHHVSITGTAIALPGGKLKFHWKKRIIKRLQKGTEDELCVY